MQNWKILMSHRWKFYYYDLLRHKTATKTNNAIDTIEYNSKHKLKNIKAHKYRRHIKILQYNRKQSISCLQVLIFWEPSPIFQSKN